MLSNRQGYVALLSVLMVSAIASTTILILFITSVNATLNSRDIGEGRSARALADACAEIALQWVTEDAPGLPCTNCGSVSIVQGTCEVEEIADLGGGTSWRIRSSGKGVHDTIEKYIEINASRPTLGVAATVSSWKEVDGVGWP